MNIFKEIEADLLHHKLQIDSVDQNRPWGGFFVIKEEDAQRFSNIYFNEYDVEKKTEFEQAQQILTQYRDAHKNVNTTIASTALERLESEYVHAFSIYVEMAKQVESKKIK